MERDGGKVGRGMARGGVKYLNSSENGEDEEGGWRGNTREW